MAKVIRAIKPNAGIRAKYRKRLVSLLDEMQRSVVWWLRAEYRKQETRIAQDASPASDLQDRLKRLFRYWTKRWRESAESFAREFVGSTRRRTEAGMRQALKDAGFTVRMEGSRAMSDVARALFEENVNLIKSIPQHYFTEVTGLVQRSASMGRDVEFLADELHKRYEITRRRARIHCSRSIQQGDRGHQAGTGQGTRHHRRRLGTCAGKENEPPYPPAHEWEKVRHRGRSLRL